MHSCKTTKKFFKLKKKGGGERERKRASQKNWSARQTKWKTFYMIPLP